MLKKHKTWDLVASKHSNSGLSVESASVKQTSKNAFNKKMIKLNLKEVIEQQKESEQGDTSWSNDASPHVTPDSQMDKKNSVQELLTE